MNLNCRVCHVGWTPHTKIDEDHATCNTCGTENYIPCQFKPDPSVRFPLELETEYDLAKRIHEREARDMGGLILMGRGY